MTDMTIANTIRSQIGRKALFMLGAKNLVGSKDGLTFKVGRNAKGVTHVKVTLTPLDLYNVEFIRVWGTKITPKAECAGIYVDMLHAAIEEHTGMYTSL
jgi:hypothetical protein